MERICERGEIHGRIEAPASKSAMQRAIACALLANGRSEIQFSGHPCADSLAAGRIAATLGAKVRWAQDRLTVEGSPMFLALGPATVPGGDTSSDVVTLDCGESGLCIRMFSPIASLLGNKVILRAEGSLATRPMTMMESPFSQLGVRCTTDSGHPPVELQGPLRGGTIVMDSGGSSQFLTGLLMAVALTREGGRVGLTNPVSKGYLALTAEVCGRFGVKVEISEDYKEYTIPGGQRYRPADLKVEGDWSSGAFLAVAAALTSRQGLSIDGLDPASSQPDRTVLEALRSSGAKAGYQGGLLIVRKEKALPFVFDATQSPDLFPPLAVLAAAADGVSVLKGTSRLKGKESDRATSLQRCFAALGVQIELGNDEMRVYGGHIEGGTVDACGDHRIAMAAATAALVASSPVRIVGSDCVGKSWPRFYEDLDSLRI